MDKETYVALAVFLAIPLFLMGYILFVPTSGGGSEQVTPTAPRDTVENSTGDFLLQEHEMRPKFRPPTDWDTALSGPSGNPDGPGFVDGSITVLERARQVNRTAEPGSMPAKDIIEQVRLQIYKFDSYGNTGSYYEQRTAKLGNKSFDAVTTDVDAASRCRAFYFRSDKGDIMQVPCHYGNLVFDVKASSTVFKARQRAQTVISVVEDKL